MSEPLYVAARRVCLDALFALAPHGRALIVVGTQAIYLRTGDTDLAFDHQFDLEPAALEAQDPHVLQADEGLEYLSRVGQDEGVSKFFAHP